MARKASKRFESPTMIAERAVTLIASDADKGWYTITTVGTHTLWTPPTGKKVTITSYKAVGHTKDEGAELLAILEYKFTVGNVSSWEKLDFLKFSGVDNQEMTDTLPQEHVTTGDQIRLRVIGESTNFSITVLLEGLEK